MSDCLVSADPLGFLIADIARLMRGHFATLLTGSPLTFAEARALIIVARFEGARQVELAALAEVQPITMARLIDTLVEHQCVERRPDPSDRRAFRIYLAQAAEPELARFRDCGIFLQQQALQGLDETAVRAMLLQLRQNLTALRQESEDGPSGS